MARGGGIAFNNIMYMSGFQTDILVLPLITSITGIWFWLTIADKLTPMLGGNKLVIYLSNHTFYIMFFHMSFFFLYNCLISRIPAIRTVFDFEAFHNTVWCRFEPVTAMRLFYFLAGVGGSLLISRCFNILKARSRIIDSLFP